MFESTIDSAFSLSFSPSSLRYPEHPIPVSNGELSRRTVLIPGAIVQPGITPPVVPDCCERSFLLRSYINRLRSPAKRDPTSSLSSAKAAATAAIVTVSPSSPVRIRCFVFSCPLLSLLTFCFFSFPPLIATRRVVKFGIFVEDLHRDSDHLNLFPNGRIFPLGWPLVSASSR